MHRALRADEAVQLRGGVHVLGEKVCWVGNPVSLPQLKLLPPQALLDPQAVAFQVAQLAEALPRCSPNRG